MLELLRAFLSSRGTQVVARYIGTAAAMLAARWGLNVDSADLSSFSATAGAMLVWIACAVLDHYSHAKQKE